MFSSTGSAKFESSLKMDVVDQPNSICHIQSIHMYPLQPPEPDKSVPFGLLAGEMVLHIGSSVDGLIAVTNYRLYLQNGENQFYIPLGLIENVEIRELFYLQLFCKDARTYRCTFENNETALTWYDQVSKAAEPQQQLEQVFAFYHCIWAKEKGGEDVAFKIESQKKYTFDKDMFESEMARMQFQGDSWRITKANENYKLCPTYPPYLLVPSCINDEMLESVAKFRSSRRIPAAVWRHTRNGAIIARCSQPEVGWLGWRSSEDEDLLKAISEACNFDRNLRTNGSSDKDSVLSHSPGSLHSDESLQITGDVEKQEKKLLIMDARSYTTAVANRARGGGCECNEYYPNCEIQFMNLANIHAIRKSFHALRQLCMSSADQPNWFSLLEGTRWLLHMSGLIKAAVTLTTAVERDARPVLVHCSDGWDRTPQIIALGELLLDPYYRTVDGFRVLIEREWLGFGHKFADRCGQSGGSEDANERCPVFLQWLDCVHQLVTQFPISFEFSQNYLIKLAQHTYSNLYGTFLCNTKKQRGKVVAGRTFSVWEFLNLPSFRNHLYTPPTTSTGKVLWPKTNVRDLRLWSEVYLGSMEANFSPEEGSGGACPGPPELNGHAMPKTRSYGDLMNAETCQGFYNSRRSSDPNVKQQLKLLERENALNTLTTAHNGDHPIVLDSAPDFLPSDLEDNPADCNQDCMFNEHAHLPTSNLTDDQIDGLDFTNGECRRGTSNSSDEDAPPTFLTNGGRHAAETSEREESEAEPQVFGNGERKSEETDAKIERSDSETDGFMENNNNSSGSDGSDGSSKGVCKGGEQVGQMLDLERSVETSTETLVSEQLMAGSSPKEYNGFEKIQKPLHTMDDAANCKVCSQNVKVGNDNCIYPSRMSVSPNGWGGAYMHHHHHAYRYRCRPIHCQLGEDGLMPIRSPTQERLDQIVEEHRKKVELLEKELHTSRQYLIKQACHRCQNGDNEKQDDSSSVVESVNSASEGQASAGESLRSDLSWVAVEDGILAECQGTLWVPDHAVSRCTGCGTEFWLGRRRHHCRKCGKIFCADCSEHATPLPSEQLYNPVRVCTGCYSELRRTGACPERPPLLPHLAAAATNHHVVDSPPDRCKRLPQAPQGSQRANTQIAASSN
ncbi:myotubularin-related protein 3 isoform X2 [Sitophilus oryzae]|uniref:Lateral signaling target protein 2 homolog n=1 Tax=Sitophilus oryzae TaxID=7048 RepID=A0A6J2XTH3_SITOR|nr:myotubularin-related protein 3 isoform X2 [Sitophilus oryzae]